MKIEIEISENNEGTDSPYWLIIDPVQMMKPDHFSVANMITGPFFSREGAENFLHRTRYNFSKRAKVFCCSGYNAFQYSKKWREQDMKLNEIKNQK